MLIPLARLASLPVGGRERCICSVAPPELAISVLLPRFALDHQQQISELLTKLAEYNPLN